MAKKKAIIYGANLTAEDSDVKIEISMHVTSEHGLEKDEVERIQVALTRGIAKAIEAVPFTNFGIESIVVESLEQ